MAITQVIFGFLLLHLVGWISCLSVHDPRLSPGHLQPLGTGRPKSPIESTVDYPSPQEFFSKYVDKKIPFVILGAAKSFPAFTKWNDAYFRGTPEIANMRVSVDRDKKELPNISDYRHMKFEKFLDNFQKKELYLVDGVKKPLQLDLLLPAPIRCKETRQHLQDTAIWYSSGGTKSLFSVSHRDEIVCVIRGRNEYLMVPHMKYKDRFMEIKDENGLRGIDVDSVDFGKYPQMEDIEWMSAHLNEGDCMYMPYKWANQINSFAGKSKESIFITFSFNHAHDHKPKDCSIAPHQATLDKYQFTDLQQEEMRKEAADEARKHRHGNETHHHNGAEEGDDDDHYHDGSENVIVPEEEAEEHLRTFKGFLKTKESKTINFQQFLTALKASSLANQDITNLNLPDSFTKVTREIFNLIDFNHDALFTFGDIKAMRKNKRYEDILSDLDWKVRQWITYLDDYTESQHHGKSNEQFDEDRKARELRKKLSIHDPMEL